MLNQFAFQIGTVGGQHPYVRVGQNRPPIVVFPGLALDYQPPSWWALSADAMGLHRLSTARTVYIVHRRRGLPVGTTLQDLAAEYAELIGQEWGRVDVMGTFCGGAIAQHVALDHPEVVESLILTSNGSTLAPAGRDICLRWLGLVQTGQWPLLREDLRCCVLNGHISDPLTGGYRLMSDQARVPDPVDVRDFVLVVSSLLAQDTSRRLADLPMRTLILGHDPDVFYPAAALRAMAGAIPRSTLIVRTRKQVGVEDKHGVELHDRILDFLLSRETIPEEPLGERG